MVLPSEQTPETAAREAKARAIARVLKQVGASASDAAVLSATGRKLAAAAAKQRPASETTWTLVVGLLAKGEAGSPPPAAEDVAEGLDLLEECSRGSITR